MGVCCFLFLIFKLAPLLTRTQAKFKIVDLSIGGDGWQSVVLSVVLPSL